MRIIDLNLLLYAVNRDSEQHVAANRWLDATLSGAERVAFPWVVVLGFLRLSTSPRIFPHPITSADAVRIVDSWFDLPHVIALAPGPEHWTVLRALLEHSGTAANLTTDAHLAALAIEYDADLCSSDSDFARFRGLRWSNPIA